MGILALIKGELRIVQTSMLGSILSNLLLVLGCSFLAGGLRSKESTFQTTAASTSSSILVLASASLIIPAAFSAAKIEGGSLLSGEDGLLTISRGTSIILLLTYVSCERAGLNFFFQLLAPS